MAEELKFTASATGFNQVEAGLKGVNKELVNTSSAAQKVDSSLDRTAGTFTKLAASGQKSIFILKESLRELQAAAFTEKDTAKIAVYNKQIATTQKEIKTLESAGTSTFGALGTGANKAFGSLRNIANILPGLGISTIVLLSYEALAKVFANTVNHADNLTKTLENAASSYVKATVEVSNIKTAFQQARDGVITKEEALKLYNSTIGKTTGFVKNLNDAEVALGKNAEAYIQFTFLKAAANAALEESAKQAIKAEIRQKDINEKAGRGGALSFSNIFIKKDIDNAKKSAEDFLSIQKDFQARAEAIAKKFKFDFNGISETAPKAVKDIRTVADVLKDLKDQQEFISKSNLLINTEKAHANIAALKSAFDELLKKFKLSATNPVIVDLAFQINKEQAQLATDDLLARTKLFTVERIKTTGKQTINVPVKPKFILDQEAAAAAAKAYAEKLSSLIVDITGQAFVGLGETIGNIISEGGGFDDIFKGIFKVLGAGLKQLGVFVIAQSQLLVAIKAALIKAPALAIPLGIALVALGTAISNAVTKKTPTGFAVGTGDFGGGLALVGERGPELVTLPRHSAITPAAQTSNILNGGMAIQVYGRIVAQGSELVTIIDRATAMNRRNN